MTEGLADPILESMSAPGARPRIEAIDVVRGIAMILMALDHTRDFFGIPGQTPTDLSTASAGLFLTRWVTFFCAPTFFLLTGTGAALSLARKSTAELSRFLVTRGLWLIVLETVVVRSLSYQMNIDFRVTLLLVLWALGWSMIVLAGLVRFRPIVAAVFGIALIAGHNLLDYLPGPGLAVLHSPGFVINTPRFTVFAAYPLIPWIGVTAAGYALGSVYQWEAARRRVFLLRLGLGLIAAFLVLRGINGYGDPFQWGAQSRPGFAVLSFLNVTKYPPSLLFLCMTLGPALLLLRAMDRGTPSFLRPALTIGKVPLFYYVLHFTLIHLLAAATGYFRYGAAHWFFESPDLGHYPFSPPPGWGYGLPTVYALWFAVVVTMYPLCRWFAAQKQQRRNPWLSYL